MQRRDYCNSHKNCFKHLNGKFALHPFCKRKLKIVFDEAVDPEFGTGMYNHFYDMSDTKLNFKEKPR